MNNNDPVLKADIGEKGMRDPFIYRKQDGDFVVLATDMWNSEYIQCYDSKDLVTFTNSRLLHLNNNGMHAWAPEVIYDNKSKYYLILWSGNTDRNRIYVSYTKDFIEVSEAEIFFDPGFDVIDANIKKEGDTYYLYFKDERDPDESPYEGKRIKAAYSNELKPRAFDNQLMDVLIGEPMFEAPMLLNNMEDGWLLYGDSYYPENGKFYGWKSKSLTSGEWIPLKREDYNPPLNAKHPAYVEVSEKELELLVKKWGKRPEWNRIRSYSSPEAYLTTVNNGFITIEVYPFDPYQEMLWKIVKDKPNGDNIYLESITYPGNFVSIEKFVCKLNSDKNKASSFTLTRGFTNNDRWHAIESIEFRGKFMQIDGKHIRIKTIETEEDEKRATFQIGY
ncbi:alpha-L-arabinofuranosidase B-like protein [Saliterribacillus persicus]|uniref:Alpha-L-arabinofuranosidase B-like protein n=2 Tax=Saliterribacillus persicus TaxID=930114 RepID=A0A368XVI8_9BACI|nr:alpha-L-arabinofuranosidase B-like protein [Saliterribacillus persicus]